MYLFIINISAFTFCQNIVPRRFIYRRKPTGSGGEKSISPAFPAPHKGQIPLRVSAHKKRLSQKPEIPQYVYVISEY